MFCTNCGANIPNDAVFCTSCGAKMNQAQQQVPTNPAPTSYAPTNQGAAPYAPVNQGDTPYAQGNQGGYPNQPTYGRPQYTQNPQTKKYLTIGGIIVGALILLFVLGTIVKSVTTPGYTKPIDYMVDGMESGKMNTLLKAFPDFMTKEMKKSLEYFTDDIDEYMQEYIVASLESQYGKGFKVSYRIEDKEKLSSKAIRSLEDDIEYSYDKEVDIKEAYELEVEMIIKGKNDDDSDIAYLTVVKIGSKWYCMDNMFGF